MKSDNICVTVLMSVYNDSKYLNNSVRSILNQSYKDFEFLIIDDGSTDNAEEIISGFNDSRIRYKRIEHSGLAAALNFGIANSNYKWIARIDADDVNTSNRLQTQINFINENPDYDVVAGWSVYFKYPEEILFLLKTPVDNQEINKFLNLHNPINHSSVIFNKEVIKSNGGYNENFKCFEDFELWFRLKDKLKFKILPEYLVYTAVRANSMSQNERKENLYQILIGNAVHNYESATDKSSHIYWNNILFWIEYFYGSKSKARQYLSKDVSFKKTLAFLNTFLPDKSFKNLIELRLRYRIESKFRNKKMFAKELKSLLK